jgi:hypothetical protein
LHVTPGFLMLGLVTSEEQQRKQVLQLKITIEKSKLAIGSLNRVVSEAESRLQKIERPKRADKNKVGSS